MAFLYHLEPLVSEGEFLHGRLRAFGFYRSADEFHYAGAGQLPTLYHRAIIFTPKLDRDVAVRSLVAVADVVQPIEEGLMIRSHPA